MPLLQIGIDVGGTSIKAAAIADGVTLWKRQSGFYRRPSFDQLRSALKQVIPEPIDGPVHCGLCVPGLMDLPNRRVTLAVNVPGLVDINLDELLASVIGPNYQPATIVNDGVACATDAVMSLNLTGRSLVLAMGTGVGAAVLDDLTPLMVEGASPGHVGQFDVSVPGYPLIGPDGGAGSLEGYVGAVALTEKYGPDLEAALSSLRGDEPFLLALAHAVRLCHAIYRPHHVILCGGVGIRLKKAVGQLMPLIRNNLTSIARPDWTLGCGLHDFHAALGAARQITMK